VFKQLECGTWTVNLDKPFFKEAKIKYTKDICKDGQVAKPRAIHAIELGGQYHIHVSYSMHSYVLIYNYVIYIAMSYSLTV
jgi:hypothetical protein